MRFFITADIHHSIQEKFLPLSQKLAQHCLEQAENGDVLLLAGDNACGDLKGLKELLELFDSFPGPRALVPGNHDLWSHPDKGVGSDILYRESIPKICAQAGFHYLDQSPLKVGEPQELIGIAGCYGGFDFSLADLTQLNSEDKEIVLEGWRTGLLDNLFWNDYRFTWNSETKTWDHAQFSKQNTQRLTEHLNQLESDERVKSIVCITHTAAVLDQAIGHPNGAQRPDFQRAWFRGILGSKRLGSAIQKMEKVALHVCGHTHYPKESTDPSNRHWVNIGCDYPRKRWLIYEPGEGYRFSDWIQ